MWGDVGIKNVIQMDSSHGNDGKMREDNNNEAKNIFLFFFFKNCYFINANQLK